MGFWSDLKDELKFFGRAVRRVVAGLTATAVGILGVSFGAVAVGIVAVAKKGNFFQGMKTGALGGAELGVMAYKKISGDRVVKPDIIKRPGQNTRVAPDKKREMEREAKVVVSSLRNKIQEAGVIAETFNNGAKNEKGITKDEKDESKITLEGQGK